MYSFPESVQILFFAMATEYISYDDWKRLMIGKYISENGISNSDFLSAQNLKETIYIEHHPRCDSTI